MLPRNHPDRMQIAFDDHRLVAHAGLILPAENVGGFHYRRGTGPRTHGG